MTLGSQRCSIPEGDLVLAIAPPYLGAPWMGVGIPLLYGILDEAGLRARVARLLDDPLDTPAAIVDLGLVALYGDPSLEERGAAMQSLAETCSEWLDSLTATLLSGPERIFGLSVWRHNADVTLEVARRIKLARPDARIVLGGPEALEALDDLTREWVDVIVHAAAEPVITAVVRACLEGKERELAALEGVWVSPRFRPAVHLTRRRLDAPPRPRIDYRTLLPVFMVERWLSVPVLLNVGCPFRCGFCTNTSLYPETTWGSVERLTEEITDLARAWAELHSGAPPSLHIEMCDATVNAQPAQLDRFLAAVAAADLPSRPVLHGSFVVDHRITPARVRALIAAGFESLFFGLESASPRVRRAMKKPGTVGSVRRALTTMRDAGRGALRANYNFIVGWPDETEAEHYETLAFVEWTSQLGIVTDVGVMPLSRSRLAMDASLFANASGAENGVAWRAGGPAGSPEVRCRRFMGVFERFYGVLPVTSVLPRRKVIRWMMPELPENVLDAWCKVHGEHDRVAGPAIAPPVLETAPEPADAPETWASELERWLEPVLLVGTEIDGWVVQAVRAPLEAEAAVIELENATDARVAALYVTPLRPSAPAFQRTSRFNVSYMDRLKEGEPLAVDLELTRTFCRLIAQHERQSAA